MIYANFNSKKMHFSGDCEDFVREVVTILFGKL